MEKQRVNFTELLDIDEITHYNNKPFTGIAFQLYDSNEVKEEVEIVKQTTSNEIFVPNPVFDSSSVTEFQRLIRKIPIADNVVEYAVKMISKSRPGADNSFDLAWAPWNIFSAVFKSKFAIIRNFLFYLFMK